jgi:hypothetical protein
MMKINDYTVLTATKNNDLGVLVKCYIDQGWQPYGSPYLDRNGTERQVVVVYEETKAKELEIKRGFGSATSALGITEDNFIKPAKAKPKKGAKNED